MISNEALILQALYLWQERENAKRWAGIQIGIDGELTSSRKLES
jgi:hypothetical protein